MTILYEAEIANGLTPIAQDEIQQFIEAHDGKIRKQHRPHELLFTYGGDITDVLNLQTVIAAYQVLQFPVPRPKALLGHQHFTKLISAIQAIIGLHPEGAFQSLYIGAAGSDSSVMTRIKQELSVSLGLSVAEDEGDLLLRIRPTPQTRNSWDVLIRLSPRPLATRSWRVCNMEGSLNAAVANAMIRLTNPTPQDTFLNIACGSGTIMIERAAYGQSKHIIGCDVYVDILDCACENIEQSGHEDIQLLHSDGMMLPLKNQSIDALCSDLPFGNLIGSHQENEWMYPAILAEAARVARPKARFVIMTLEVRLMENTLALQDSWQVQQVQMVTLSGLHPRIFVLERNE